MATTEIGIDFTDEQLSTFGEEYEPKSLVLQQQLAIERIPDDATFQRIATAGLDAAANIKAIEAYLAPIKEARHKAWKRVCDVLTDKTRPFLEVKEKASRLVAQYQYEQQQEKKRRDEAERVRLAKEEEERRSLEAEQLAKEGRVAEGVALLEMPVVDVMPAVSTAAVPKIKGVGAAREKFYAEVTDLMVLVKAVTEGKVPLQAVEANQRFLDNQARQFERTLQYPGVAVKRDFGSSFRTK